MSEVRQRIAENKPHNEAQGTAKLLETDEDGTDAETVMDENAGATLPQDTGKTTEALDAKLESLPPRWRNWVVRGIFTWVMIFGFSFIIWLGPLALVLLVLLIQIKCFNEIITIGYAVYKSHDLPWFRTLSWYLLISSNYFFYGESMIHYFGVLLSRAEFASFLVKYHRFISFTLYCGGFVGFVCSLRKKYYLKQFTLFGYTHVTLLLIVAQSHLIVQNIFEGLIWFLVPVSMIICNDIMAYMFGFFFGKTPLIKLSPKKTWEGFIGGAFSTVLYGIVISLCLIKYDFFVCPINYDEVAESLSMECQRSIEFIPQAYQLPTFIAKTGGLFRQDWSSITVAPFVLHSISMSLFASVLGPFGGFFASGFKRAFKIKDFGDTIPGHGGLMDRFDCQLLMATFVNVYHSSFIKVLSPQRMLTTIMTLPAEDQVNIYNVLHESLLKRGLLPS